MRRRITISVVGVALIIFGALMAQRVWPLIFGINRSEAPLLWWTLVILLGVVVKHLLVSAALGIKRLALKQCLSCGHPLPQTTTGYCPNCNQPLGIGKSHV